MLKEKYSQNAETLKFIIEFEKTVESGKVYTTQELVQLFESSPYNKKQFDTYKKSKTGSIWYALKRSGNWTRVQNGVYQKK
ncbi:hypothetical protein [Ureibacillus thermosphaericus]|uniref:hypothetical protein n=1 Tax=Ureibacillus thermosphaericus TaxID=51173 RepID=UPI0002DDD234|nr:hypothetical protein [Ureibacillus thermosphaericus]